MYDYSVNWLNKVHSDQEILHSCYKRIGTSLMERAHDVSLIGKSNVQMHLYRKLLFMLKKKNCIILDINGKDF